MRRLLRFLVLVLSISLAGLAVWVSQNATAVRYEAGAARVIEVDLAAEYPSTRPDEDFLYLGGMKSDMMNGVGSLIGNKTSIGSGGLGARGSRRDDDTDTER